MKLQLKRVHKEAIVPDYCKAYSMGCSLYACTDKPVFIEPHTTKLIPTGWIIVPPVGYYMNLVSIDSIAIHKSLRLSTGYSVCDYDYRGELFIPIYNDSDKEQMVCMRDRLALLILKKCETCEFEEVAEFDA